MSPCQFILPKELFRHSKHLLAHRRRRKYHLSGPVRVSQVLLDQLFDAIFMTRVYERIKLINHKRLNSRHEEFVAISAMLHPLKCRHAAIQPSRQLFRLNFMILARPEPTEAQRHFILKWLQAICDNLLN